MSVRDNLEAVRAQLDAACVAAGRDPAEVQLLAVSKTKPGALIVEAHGAGQRDFGENYAQELRDKARDLTLDGLRWHYIGQLQTNKAKYIAPVAYRVHALETVAQAEALAKRAPATLRCLVAVNIGQEPQKGGVMPSEALDRVRELHGVEGIEVVGLMCIPPHRDDPEEVAPFFEAMAALAAEGRAQGLPLTELSMGMSSDFHVAVRYGATWVRVGTAIFGARG
jgi:pyridoxal phosphate enzyme (YggS family)